jgi:hypothetical protein
MKNRIFVILCFFASISVQSQIRNSTIDTVISYQWGEGQNGGQSSEYFPKNIFGKPDTAARSSFQSSDPNQICSFGFGGEIIVAFNEFEIVDGPGPDFTIYENAFINPINKKIFAEPAMVSVSDDGITFYHFPFDSATLVGCAGITPTNGDKDCYNPRESGGDKFDLATVGLSRAKYIKIKDITTMLLDNPQHYYYDPILSGFDLDAVIGLNLDPIEVASVDDEEYVQQNGNLVEMNNKYNITKLEMYNLSGNLVNVISIVQSQNLALDETGVFCLVFYSGTNVVGRKIILL